MDEVKKLSDDQNAEMIEYIVANHGSLSNNGHFGRWYDKDMDHMYLRAGVAIHSCEQVLSFTEPIHLQPSETNATAYAHALKLACFEYPEAFGHSYKMIKIEEAKDFFLNTKHTLALGKASMIGAGISVDHIDSEVCHLKFLFRHKTLKGRGSGKLLLKSALDFVQDQSDYEYVYLDTTKSNESARKLYSDIGFSEDTHQVDDSIIGMTLEGRDSIAKSRSRIERMLYN